MKDAYLPRHHEPELSGPQAIAAEYNKIAESEADKAGGRAYPAEHTGGGCYVAYWTVTENRQRYCYSVGDLGVFKSLPIPADWHPYDSETEWTWVRIARKVAS